ncbi:hypothetical protein BD779DRAFT_665718 [Infundibulicybe gibba]|nr:hypothetical protein BD779DRAFT_665718 [Infundibulicybe gibba]
MNISYYAFFVYRMGLLAYSGVSVVCCLWAREFAAAESARACSGPRCSRDVFLLKVGFVQEGDLANSLDLGLHQLSVTLNGIQMVSSPGPGTTQHAK